MYGTLDLGWRLLLGLLAGGAIGLEREWRQKMAGVRTNALVALGAAGFVSVATLLDTPQDSRIAAQIVTGVGFLGGGVILREGFNVHGLNTAATLWCAAMVGTLAGSGFAWATAVATGMVVVANLALRPLVHRLDTRLVRSGKVPSRYTVTVLATDAALGRVRAALLSALADIGLTTTSVASNADAVDGLTRLNAHAEGVCHATAVETALAALAADADVRGSGWTEERSAPDG